MHATTVIPSEPFDFAQGELREWRDLAQPAITVRFDRHTPTPDQKSQTLAVAIPLRRTCRHVFSEVLRQAQGINIFPERSASEVEGLPSIVSVTTVTDGTHKRSIADLAAAATRDAFSQKPFRRELSHWIRNNFTKQYDGMPGFTNGIPDIPSLLGPTLIRFVNIGKKQATDEHAWITSSPLLVLLST